MYWYTLKKASFPVSGLLGKTGSGSGVNHSGSTALTYGFASTCMFRFFTVNQTKILLFFFRLSKRKD
jgi:hypothetical protein